MLNGDEATPSISLVGFNHLVKMLMWKTGIFVIQTSDLFQEKLLLITSYSCTVTNYCESKSDIYSLLIRINLFK